MDPHRQRRDRDRDRDSGREARRRRNPNEEEDSDSPPPVNAKPKRTGLNDYWIDGSGINREVLQRQICFMLGNEARSKPDKYNVCPSDTLLNTSTNGCYTGRSRISYTGRQAFHPST